MGESSAVRVIHVVRPLTGAEKNGGAEIALKIKDEGNPAPPHTAQKEMKIIKKTVFTCGTATRDLTCK